MSLQDFQTIERSKSDQLTRELHDDMMLLSNSEIDDWFRIINSEAEGNGKLSSVIKKGICNKNIF